VGEEEGGEQWEPQGSQDLRLFGLEELWEPQGNQDPQLFVAEEEVDELSEPQENQDPQLSAWGELWELQGS
jgi:hypothetical protein